ncbi:MAG: hypothetical protein DRJ05_04355 [Bacteroidetes bacterium]|nr:MAG: hypothetical protein DRJ05_04355 [Bacteroidota bacterium]
MDLSKILSISGKPGLYQTMAQTKNGLVVESLADGKKFTAFSHEKISSMEEISIYTTDEDRPLKEVLKSIFTKQEGKKILSHKSSATELKAFFKEMVPDYDDENVYVSDIKKVVNWYNTLVEHDLLDLEEDEVEEVDKDEKEKGNTEGEEKPESPTTETEEK